MNRSFRFAALTLALTAPISVAVAKPVEEKAVLSGKAKLDPTMGYIFISGPVRQSGVFLRVPDQESWKTYEEERRKAFDKALKRYPAQLARWKSDADIARQTNKEPPERPVEPTLETFSIDPIELRDAEPFGPFFVYAKGESVSYMNVVKAGTWIWYGPVMLAANGTAVGTCLCLGSVRFEVKPGVVTDLGTSLLDAPRWDDEMDVARLTLKESNAKRIAEGKEPLKVLRGDVKYGLPASLKGWPSVQGELRASGKMNNYYGVVISRMAPIPGVLAYRRDTVVDARSGQEIASPTLVSRAKIKK